MSNAETVWIVPHQPATLTAFKVTGVAISCALFATLLTRVALSLAAGTSAWLVLPAFLLGYLLADMLSGTAHWICDTFFEEDTPVIGQLVIRPFREHHVYPQRITLYRFIEQDTMSFLLMLPPLAVAFWLGAPQQGSGAALLWCCCLLASRRDHSGPISSTSGRTSGIRRWRRVGCNAAASSSCPSVIGAITATTAVASA